MKPYSNSSGPSESLRLEAVTTCVGFDDILDLTLTENHAHMDTMIIVTSHEDKRTQMVAQKHGAICVQTDLFHKNGRNFNKGAAINAGMARFQYRGWRLIHDADIITPDNFRRLLFNHTHLDEQCIYGCDRFDVIGVNEWRKIKQRGPQSVHRSFVTTYGGTHSARYVDPLRGYVPLGCFQLYHASCEHSYPYSLGTAAHDDIMFAEQWPQSQRRLLPTVLCYHLVSHKPTTGENWEGRKSPHLDT